MKSLCETCKFKDLCREGKDTEVLECDYYGKEK
jgi:hypothetical protein